MNRYFTKENTDGQLAMRKCSLLVPTQKLQLTHPEASLPNHYRVELLACGMLPTACRAWKWCLYFRNELTSSHVKLNTH